MLLIIILLLFKRYIMSESLAFLESNYLHQYWYTTYLHILHAFLDEFINVTAGNGTIASSSKGRITPENRVTIFISRHVCDKVNTCRPWENPVLRRAVQSRQVVCVGVVTIVIVSSVISSCSLSSGTTCTFERHFGLSWIELRVRSVVLIRYIGATVRRLCTALAVLHSRGTIVSTGTAG